MSFYINIKKKLLVFVLKIIENYQFRILILLNQIIINSSYLYFMKYKFYKYKLFIIKKI